MNDVKINKYFDYTRKHFEGFIQASIESGRFASAREVIRAGLRLVEEEEQKLKNT